MTPFPMIEKAVREVLRDRFDNVGRALTYEKGQPLYIWLALVPGGRTTELDGTWVLDIDTFADTYNAAMEAALEIETLLLKPYHKTTSMRLDRTTQNQGPAERPWDDEGVYRIGSVYTFEARRT